jgi:hemoglobin-like flavoprotein
VTPEQIDLVKTTFSTFAKYPLGTGLMFYQRLFGMNQNLRGLFKGEIAAQAQAMMSMMDLIVRMLDDASRVEAEVYALGWRHARYGIGADYYPVFGRALVSTVRDALGIQATPAICDAWQAAYDAVAETMVAAGQDALAGRPPRFEIGATARPEAARTT